MSTYSLVLARSTHLAQVLRRGVDMIRQPVQPVANILWNVGFRVAM